jgi:uncharacterized protein (TIGR03435 family)
MERLVLECSIRAVLIAAGTAAILRLMGAKTAAARHAAWAGVLLLMMVLPVWTAWGPKAELRVLAAPATARQTIAPMASRPGMGAAPVSDATVIRVDASVAAHRGFEWSPLEFILFVYAMGALWLLTRLAIGTFRAGRLRREANGCDGGLLTSEECVAPMTVGWLCPAIILPLGWREWTRGRLDAVLAHERAHVRRRDPLVQWLALLNRAVFWFHPLAWWLERRLASLAEEACDAAVLDQGHDPVEYAEALLDIERSVKQAGARMEAMGMAMPGRGLPQRIKLIFDGPRWPRMSRSKIVCIAAACSATAAVFGAGTLGHVTQLHLPPIPPPQVDASSLVRTAPPVQRVQKPSSVLLAQATQVEQTSNQPAVAPVPKFDVASIRPCTPAPPGPGGRGGVGSPSPGRVNARCVTVKNLIQTAYVMYPDGLNPNPNPNFVYVTIEGGAAWTESDRYDIEAKAEGTPSTQMTEGPMLQALLEDRFQVKVHHETKQVPVYDLTVAKGGFKLEPLKEGSCVPFETRAPAPGQTPADFIASLPNYCGRVSFHRPGPGGSMKAEFRGMTLAEFAGSLGRVTDRPIVDSTGITGLFDISMEFAVDQTTPAFLPGGALRGDPPRLQDFAQPPLPDAPAGASIVTAIQEQLGLKLEPAKGPGEFLVIDRVERPSEN